MAYASPGGQSRLPALGPPGSPSNMQITPRAANSRLELLEDRLSQQERTTQNLLDRAYRIKEDIIDSANFTHGTWQDEKRARSLLQEHIGTITEVVRKLSRDIQTIEDQMRNKDNYVEGTSNAVKNLEVHHVAGLTDLRGRVARCDASISRLSADLKGCFDSIKTLNQQQQENQTKGLDRIRDLDVRISQITTQLEKVDAEQAISLRHLEGDSSQQISFLENRTVNMIEETRNSVHSYRTTEQAEREKMEARLTAHIERLVSNCESRLTKLEMKLDEALVNMDRRLNKMEDEAQKDRELQANALKVLEKKLTGNIEANTRRQNDSMSRLKHECRTGFSTVHESISNMKQVMDGKRKLLEEQLKKEISQIRKMVVLI